MSLILHIDTAPDTASVCLAKDSAVLQLAFSENPKDHASWLHTSIAEQLQKSGCSINDLQAVSVSIGPGSYTGLRVGLAAAKGLCYALNIPLITINTTMIMAFAVKNEAPDLIAPLIDARRMEVFTAIYDNDLEEKVAPYSLVVDENSFAPFLASNTILFCGSGAKKLQAVISNQHAVFSHTIANASHMVQLSLHRFLKKEFADLAYTEPLYLKEFFSAARKS